jgi:putative SOS response-associated peptidase YedK
MSDEAQRFSIENQKNAIKEYAARDRWKDASGNAVATCSILTTAPNAVTSTVRDRMPVILDPGGYDMWLDPGMNNVAAASDLLKPCDALLMRCYP